MSYSVRGIDVSAWDPYIDWPMVKNQGIRFAIMKATEGLGYVSPAFQSQWDGAKSVGILRGAYHFLLAAQDGAKQADFFLSKVNVQDGDLPPFLDIEEADNPGATNSQFIGNAQKWLERVQSKTGRTPIIYSRALFLRDRLAGSNGKPPPWATKYPTWLAQYFNSHSPDGAPMAAPGWGDWIIWQYSGDHLTLDGIYRDATRQKLIYVDMNVYRYSIEELYKLAKAPMPANLDAPVNPTPVQPTQPDLPQPPIVVPPVQPPIVVPPVQPVQPMTYKVIAGDNLTRISQKFGVTIDAIVKLNNLANADQIKIDQILQIPPKA